VELVGDYNTMTGVIIALIAEEHRRKFPEKYRAQEVMPLALKRKEAERRLRPVGVGSVYHRFYRSRMYVCAVMYDNHRPVLRWIREDERDDVPPQTNKLGTVTRGEVDDLMDAGPPDESYIHYHSWRAQFPDVELQDGYLVIS
jgi:hypothetical protein